MWLKTQQRRLPQRDTAPSGMGPPARRSASERSRSRFSHLRFLLRILAKGYGEFVIRGFADPGEPPPFLRRDTILNTSVPLSVHFGHE